MKGELQKYSLQGINQQIRSGEIRLLDPLALWALPLEGEKFFTLDSKPTPFNPHIDFN
jgi:hypothetical protein